jgi:regulator of protease activity HflC (stomatin/prohibitin superfamily)
MVDINTSEVAFLVETINDAGQAAIAPPGKGENQTADGDEISFYEQRMVNARKVEIPYYWKQTKRVYLFAGSGNGKWSPAARLIVVNTQPETREWTSDSSNGSSSKNQAIWVESQDSVGFSTGVSVTARIQDKKDAIKFLSNYPPKTNRKVMAEGGEAFNVEITSLEQVMDEEVRVKIQEVYAYECASYTMDDLRSKKQEILDKVQEVVVPFFAERGISITTIGQFGGFKYENPEIQKSIDKVFQAQQDEEVAVAETKAAEKRKEALKLEGEGEAAKKLAEAEGEAQSIQAVADAKAYELEKLNDNPKAYITLKMIEIAKEGFDKWDGTLPRFLMGTPDINGTNMLLDINPMQISEVKSETP